MPSPRKKNRLWVWFFVFIVVASVGVAAGVIRGWLYPVAIAVSAITTLTTPLLIKLSNRAAASLP